MRYYLPAGENIGLGQVVAAAQKSGAHAVISALPGGYETMLGRWFDEGQQLSVGEWQKVALAHAGVCYPKTKTVANQVGGIEASRATVMAANSFIN